MQTHDVIIVGAGITGLTLGYQLKKRGLDVLILEKSSSVGGVIQTEVIKNCVLELGPHTLLESNPLTELISDLGLANEVIETDPNAKKRFIVRNGLLNPLPISPIEAIKTPLLSPLAKLRACIEPCIRVGSKEDESVSDFFKRRFGNEFASHIALAALNGIWAADFSRLSTRSALPTLWNMEKHSSSIILGALIKKDKKRHKIISFKKGLSTLTNALANALHESLSLNREVLQIKKIGDIFEVSLENETITSKNVILCVEADTTGKLIHSLNQNISRKIETLPYAPLGLIHLLVRKNSVKHPLDGFGFLTSPKDNLSVLGGIFSSSIFRERATLDSHLITCFSGGGYKPELADVTKLEVQKEVIHSVSSLLSIESPPEILKTVYWPKAVPTYPLNHHTLLESVSSFEKDCKGLFLLGNWRMGISLSARIEEAFTLSKQFE